MAKPNKSAPFLHGGETTRLMQGDMLVALLPAVIIAVMQAGLRALFFSALSAFAAWAAESVWLLFVRRRPAGVAPLNTGLLVALVCPVSAPWWLPVAGSIAAVWLIRLPLGGLSRPLFHPAAFIWLLMLVIFPAHMTRFPAVSPDNILPVLGLPESFQQSASLSELLRLGSRPPYGLSELLVGNLPGGMGTTSLFVIAACAVYLIYRRAIGWQTVAGMTGICVLLAMLVDRSHAGAGWSALYEVSASAFFFAAVYIAADPAASPRLPLARFLYGVLCGGLAMIFRYGGMGDAGVPAAILIAQIASRPFDRLILYMRQGEKRDFYKLHRLLLIRKMQRNSLREENSSDEKDK